MCICLIQSKPQVSFATKNQYNVSFFVFRKIHLLLTKFSVLYFFPRFCRYITHLVYRLGYERGDPRYDSRQGQEIFFSFPRIDHIGSVAHAASYSSREESGQGAILTTHFQLMPRLRVSGAILALLLYAFMAWAGTNVPLSKGTKRSKVSLSGTSVDKGRQQSTQSKRNF